MAKKTNITINGKEYYRIRLTIGADKEGNPIVKNFYGHSKSEAEQKRDEWLKKGKGKSNTSLNMAMYEWLWNILKPSKLKPATFERYEGIYRNYFEKSSLGIMRLSDIDRAVIRKYYNELFSRNKTYSQIKNAHKLLNKFFKYMIDEEILEKNPCAGMDLSQYKAKNEDFDFDDFEENEKIETFTEKEIKIILDNIPNKKLKILVAFALGTGLRQGEILALKQTDIKDMNVYVTKTVKTVKVYDDKDKKYHYETIVAPPKTKNSRRIVPIPSNLRQALNELNKIRNEEKLKLGEMYQDNGLLFPSETGTYIDARNLTRAWKRALEKAGVPYKKFHALRHTYATQLLKNGTQLITVSRLLGHSTVKTTEIYAHVLESTKKQEVESLNKLFL